MSNNAPLPDPQLWIRKIVSWLRWPPVAFMGGAISLYFLVFGRPDNLLLIVPLTCLLAWSWLGGVTDSVPRTTHWIIYAFNQVLVVLRNLLEWLKATAVRIDKIWRDQWD